jgi:hypothetical protein
MNRQTIIEKTVEVINRLPSDKAEEISDFADFVLKKHEEQSITKNIQNIISEGDIFSFLENEDDLYSLNDLKEKF